MSTLGQRMIQAADEAMAISSGEKSVGFVLHRPVDNPAGTLRRINAAQAPDVIRNGARAGVLDQ